MFSSGNRLFRQKSLFTFSENFRPLGGQKNLSTPPVPVEFSKLSAPLGGQKNLSTPPVPVEFSDLSSPSWLAEKHRDTLDYTAKVHAQSMFCGRHFSTGWHFHS